MVELRLTSDKLKNSSDIIKEVYDGLEASRFNVFKIEDIYQHFKELGASHEHIYTNKDIEDDS